MMLCCMRSSGQDKESTEMLGMLGTDYSGMLRTDYSGKQNCTCLVHHELESASSIPWLLCLPAANDTQRQEWDTNQSQHWVNWLTPSSSGAARPARVPTSAQALVQMSSKPTVVNNQQLQTTHDYYHVSQTVGLALHCTWAFIPSKRML